MRYHLIIFYFSLFGVLVSNVVYAQSKDILNIFVSIPPQKYLVERITGSEINVSVMVGPGKSPATYEPSPKQMANLNNAQLYIRIGVPFETVLIDRIKQLNSNLTIIDCCSQIAKRKLTEHHKHDGHSNIDPHIWTSPENTKQIAVIIRNALVKLDPKSSNYYEKNYIDFVNELDDLDQEIRAQLKQIKNRYLIVSHPSWGYYADSYNLEQISIEQSGSEIRAKVLIEIIKLARAENISTVYIQKQFNNGSAKLLAKEINANVVELDPLAENYIENLRHVTQAIIMGAM